MAMTEREQYNLNMMNRAAQDVKLGDIIAGLPADGGSDSSFTQMPAQADSVAADAAGLVNDFNSLLAKLRAAGLMAT